MASGSYHRSSIVMNVLLLIISCIFSLVLSEIGLTLYYRGDGSNYLMVEEFNSPYLFKSKPNTLHVEGGVAYEFNNYSMRRDGDVSETPSEGMTRILSYGDSIADGWGVQGDEMYSHVLESQLNTNESHQYEVLNMHRGVSPTIISFHIRRDIKQFKPYGVIIEIELLNDTSDEALIRTVGQDEDGLPLTIRRSRYILGWDAQLLAPITVSGSLIERTKTYALISRIVGLTVTFAKEGAIKWSDDPFFVDDSGVYYYNMQFDRFLLTERALERGFDQMFNSLKGIHRLLERHNIAFLLVILPSKYAYSHDRYWEASLQQVRKAEARAAELNLPFLSLYENLKGAGGADLFMDFCHPDADGNRAIADAIYPIVSRW